MIGAYSASKFALEGLTEAWRAELAPWRIKVILIEPGSIDTEIWAKGRRDAAEVEQPFPPEVVEQYRAHIDMARRMVDKQAKLATPPNKVARTVEAALFDPRPRTRYLVGIDAKSAGAVTRVLPDGLRSTVVNFATGTRLPRAVPGWSQFSR